MINTIEFYNYLVKKELDTYIVSNNVSAYEKINNDIRNIEHDVWSF